MVAVGGARRWWLLVVVLVGVFAALSVMALQNVSRYSGERARANLCDDYTLLRYALLSDSVASSGTVRFRASRVARQAQFASGAPQRDALPASSAADELSRLLAAPFASQLDFRTKVWPVAASCGLTTRDYPDFGP